MSDTAASRTLVEQHGLWQGQLPRNSRELWLALVALDADGRAALFALCVGRSVNALVQSWDRRPAAIAHADRADEACCQARAAAPRSLCRRDRDAADLVRGRTLANVA